MHAIAVMVEEGESMSLEAMEKVTQAEVRGKERKAAAETQAKQILADAQREGQAL